MGKQNKRVKSEAEDDVILNTELKNKKQKEEKQQAVGDSYNNVRAERVEVKAQDVVTPNTEQKKQQQKKEKHQAVGDLTNNVKSEVKVEGNVTPNTEQKKKKQQKKEKHQAVGDPNDEVKSERVEVKVEGDVTPNTDQTKKQEQKKEKHRAVGDPNNKVKSERVEVKVQGDVTPNTEQKKKTEKTQIKEKELVERNVPDHVVEPASNGAVKKRKRKQKKKQEVANENAKTNVVDKGSSWAEDQIREGFEAATDSKTIVISGLPFDMKKTKIYSHFKNCGFITQIGMSTFSEGEKISGLVYIEFETEDAAKQAVGLDGTKLRAISMKVELSKVRPKNKSPRAKISGCKIAFIGNLSRDVKEDDIREFFKDSKIESIDLALFKLEPRRCRGFGHVFFADDESLENAMKKDNVKLYERPIKVAYPVKKYTEPSKKKTKVQDV